MSKKNGKSSKTNLSRYVDPFRIDGSREFHLKSHKADEKGGIDKDKAKDLLDANRTRLRDLQEKLDVGRAAVRALCRHM